MLALRQQRKCVAPVIRVGAPGDHHDWLCLLLSEVYSCEFSGPDRGADRSAHGDTDGGPDRGADRSAHSDTDGGPDRGADRGDCGVRL